MKKTLLFLFLLLSTLVLFAQVSSEEAARIRQQMAKIRQTTDWDDPAAAKKANAEIQKLANQLSGGKPPIVFGQTTSEKTIQADIQAKAADKESVVAIADRFFKRSYKALDAISRNQFDQDYKKAEKLNFSASAVRELGGAGAALITFGNDHNFACVYIASAVKALPVDTLAVNNFGGYLRIIDSVETSLPVLLYANSLFSESPVILTQLGCSYLELNDEVKGEKYLKEALKYNPGFGQAHSALCDLYLKQGRIEDAFMELLAGVKGMGCSYMQASQNLAYMNEQAENSNQDLKQKMQDETKRQMDPSEALASLVPIIDRLKMPDLITSDKLADWMEGGGYSHAVTSYSSFHSQLMAFVNQSLEVHKQQPALGPNAVLRDYPNERFALDLLNELFFKESKKITDDYQKSVDEILQRTFDIKEDYLKRFEQYSKEYSSCVEGCGGNDYCLKECHRKYCMQECPSANKCNEQLQEQFMNFRMAFSQMSSDQTKLLDDYYGFVEPWFAKISSQYWSKIYAYEIQRIALSIIANSVGAYPQAFPFPAHNECGTDCSVYAIPTPLPPSEVEKKDPKANDCPSNSTFKISISICDLGVDCESVEFGCTLIASGSIKRNFKKDNTTIFIGVGAKAELGVVGASAKAGATVTVSDQGEVEDVGVKMDVSVGAGIGMARVGATSGGSYTVMKGGSAKLNFTAGMGKPK